MGKWCKLAIVTTVVALVLLTWFGCVVWQSHVRMERSRIEFSKPPPKGFRLPPKDFSAWRAECGANEPDPSMPEGKARLRDEERRLPEAQKEFQGILNMRQAVLTNEMEGAAQDFLDRMARLLDGFSRDYCRVIMDPVAYDWGGGNPGITFESIQSEQQCIRLIERYYPVHCQIADWFWTRCGSEYNAAGIDKQIYIWLTWTRDDCKRKKWWSAVETIDRYLEVHNRDRCDSEKSNYCRAHRWGEKLYDTVYADIIKEDPRWVKGTVRWHGVFLKSARSQLKREPKWSPDYKETAKPEL